MSTRFRSGSPSSSSRVYGRAPDASAGSAAAHPGGDPLGDRDWIVVDLHMHTNWSHDCSIEPQALVDHAEAEGLGRSPSPTTTSSAARSRSSSSPGTRKLIVIPGEEVKTDDQGEVIGLFLGRRSRAG